MSYGGSYGASAGASGGGYGGGNPHGGSRGDDRYGDSSSSRGGYGGGRGDYGGGRGDYGNNGGGRGGYGGGSSYGGGGASYGGGGASYGGGSSYGGGGGYGPPGGQGGYDGGSSGLGGKLQKESFDASNTVAFEKNFYIEHPAVKARSDDDAAGWRTNVEISVVGRGIPKPCFTFEEASMPEYVLKEVLQQGFDKPSPIQSQGWPMALHGRDMIGISATGSGKTLAFLLPAMIHINAQV